MGREFVPRPACHRPETVLVTGGGGVSRPDLGGRMHAKCMHFDGDDIAKMCDGEEEGEKNQNH